MTKAVIKTGGKQYLVSKGDVLDVELVDDAKKTVTFTPLLVTDGTTTKVGTPEVTGASVKAKLVETVRADKVTAIRFKAKKRVHKRHGHKQSLSRIEITDIS
jgi:large subunit ribosomal protein L21